MEPPLNSKASTIMGPFIMGYIFSAVFLGIMGMQLFLYFIHHARDKLWLKLLVSVLFLANVLDVVFKLVYLYRTLIVSFASTEQLLRITWLVDIGPIFTITILLFLQLFFAWRVFELTSNWVYVIPIVMAAIASAAGGFWYTSKLARTSDATRTPENKIAVLLWLLPGLVSYTLIFLAHISHQYQFPKADTRIDQAIRAVVQTCLLVLVLAATDIITYLASRQSNLYLIFNLPLSGAFSTTLMSCLNSRAGWACRRLPYERENLNPERSFVFKTGELLEFASSRRQDSTFAETTFQDTYTQDNDDKDLEQQNG